MARALITRQRQPPWASVRPVSSSRRPAHSYSPRPGVAERELPVCEPICEPGIAMRDAPVLKTVIAETVDGYVKGYWSCGFSFG